MISGAWGFAKEYCGSHLHCVKDSSACRTVKTLHQCELSEALGSVPSSKSSISLGGQIQAAGTAIRVGFIAPPWMGKAAGKPGNYDFLSCPVARKKFKAGGCTFSSRALRMPFESSSQVSLGIQVYQ